MFGHIKIQSGLQYVNWPPRQLRKLCFLAFLLLNSVASLNDWGVWRFIWDLHTVQLFVSRIWFVAQDQRWGLECSPTRKSRVFRAVCRFLVEIRTSDCEMSHPSRFTLCCHPPQWTLKVMAWKYQQNHIFKELRQDPEFPKPDVVLSATAPWDPWDSDYTAVLSRTTGDSVWTRFWFNVPVVCH